ncbi:Rossmann-like domain-containing protein [Pseudodesulfovibrio sp.]|uniref:Rossmann-like domain-containing protein n=1 Tax=unclassified Pseudodesulfovibrio TaxID=2661612 RepID=UPI003B007922
MSSTLETVRQKAHAIWQGKGILGESITVTAGPLTVEQAIGNPEGTDFPIQKGKEKLMDAVFRGQHGQAFTDHYGNFAGTLSQVIGLPFDNNFNRAVFVATLNAVCRATDQAGGTIHCKDTGPKECSKGIVDYIHSHYKAERIAMIGFQPALAEALNGSMNLRLVDLDPDNVGQTKRGVFIEGGEATDEVVAWGDMLLVTGTTLANDSIGMFLTDKPVLFYGTTISGAASLMGWDRYCPKSA